MSLSLKLLIAKTAVDLMTALPADQRVLNPGLVVTFLSDLSEGIEADDKLCLVKDFTKVCKATGFVGRDFQQLYMQYCKGDSETFSHILLDAAKDTNVILGKPSKLHNAFVAMRENMLSDDGLKAIVEKAKNEKNGFPSIEDIENTVRMLP